MKSIQEHLEFTGECFDFILEFTWIQHLRSPEQKISHILRNQTLLEYMLRTGPAETGTLPETGDTLLKRADLLPLEEKVWRNGMRVMRQAVMEHAAAYYEQVCVPNPLFPSGLSLRYDPPRTDVPSDWCVFHIYNALAPDRSFLDDETYLIRCFEAILDDALSKHDFRWFYTMTWLNAIPRWLHFFPAEWHENLSEPNTELYGNLGFLGQLLNRRGNLNKVTCGYLLKHGRLMYQPRKSICSCKSMRDHLQKLPCR